MKHLACVLALTLTGCASAPIVVRTVRVEVPVSVPCKTPSVEAPAWATDALPADATLFQRVQALAVENEQRRAYDMRLEAAAKSCQ